MKILMKDSFSNLLKACIASLLALLFITPSARAGLNLEVNLYVTSQGQTYVFYTPLTTNAVAPAAAFGTYVIQSPGWPTNGSRRGYELTTTNGLIDRTEFDTENGYSTIPAALQQMTNGQWSILFTNLTSTNLYKFTVSAAGFNTNMLPSTIISQPLDGSFVPVGQTNYFWKGPTNWGGSVLAQIYNNDFSYDQYDYLPSTTTNWSPVMPPPAGTNYYFNLSYNTNYAANIFTTTTPLSTNTSTAISGWTSTSVLGSGSYIGFNVFQPGAPSSGHTNLAYYNFEDNTLFTADRSGNGNNIGGYGWFTIPPYITNAAASGIYAAGFSGDGQITVPTNLFAPLSSSFSVSLWVKTAQTDGNDSDDEYAAYGIFTDLSGDTANSVMPMGLTGSKLAFYTGGTPDNLMRSQASINTGTYVHLVTTRDQNTGEKRIYINGALDSSVYANTSLLAGGDPTQIHIGLNNGNTISGSIDEVQIYSGVLSSSEVAYLYAHPSTNVADVVATVVGLAAAVGDTNHVYSTFGDANWFIENTNTYDGYYAAQSGVITNFQTATLQTTVTGPGTFSFYWQTAANDFDYDLEVDMDGNYQSDIYGNTSWNNYSIPIPSGTHTVSWTAYAGDTADDAGWVDSVTFIPSATPPTVTNQPYSCVAYAGTAVGFTGDFSGSQPITYQWKKNSFAISGANTNALVLLNVSSNDTGNYSLTGANSGGSATTTNATLTVTNDAALPIFSLFKSALPFDTNSSSIGRQVVVAPDHTIYVAGQFSGTNSFGTNVLSTTNSSALFVGRLDIGGNWIWIRKDGGFINSPNVIALDASGQLLLGGSFQGKIATFGSLSITNPAASNIYNAFVARYTSNGVCNLALRYGGTNGAFVQGLDSDSSNNIYASGVTDTYMGGAATGFGTNVLPIGGFQAVVASYGSNGTLRWVQVGGGSNVTFVDSVKVLGSSVFFAGWNNGTFSIANSNMSGTTNLFIGKCATSNGALQMLKEFGPSDTNFYIYNNYPSLAMGPTNTLYVGGYMQGTNCNFGSISVASQPGNNSFLARFDINGNFLMGRLVGDTNTHAAVTVSDASGNVYFGGGFSGETDFGGRSLFNGRGPGYNLVDIGNFVAKYTPSGNLVWARGTEATTGGGGTYFDEGAAVDSSGVVYMATAATGTVVFGKNGVTNSVQTAAISRIVKPSITLLNPSVTSTNFQFTFASISGLTHTILYRTNILTGTWQTYTNLTGTGSNIIGTLPLSAFGGTKQGFVKLSTQ